MRAFIFVLFWSCLSYGAVTAASETESAAAPEVSAVVKLEEVPRVVMDTARSRMPDAYFQRASWVLEDDFKVYSLAGSYFRKEVTVYVREDGKFLRTETNNRDED